MMADRFRNFACLFYPENISREELVKGIENLHVPAFLSPLHCGDLQGNEAETKPHWHFVIMFSGVKTLKQVNDLLEFGKGTKAFEIHDLGGYARYITHINNPEKEQFSPDLVECFAGSDYSFACETVADSVKTCYEICEFCISNDIRYFHHLVKYCMKWRMDWFRVLRLGGMYFVKEYLRSVSWEQKELKEKEENDKIRSEKKDCS